MKEATGELNMTVITLIAVAAIGTIFYFVIWPLIQTTLMNNTCKTFGEGWHAVQGNDIDTATNTKITYWSCCPKGVTDATNSECMKTETDTE